MKLKLIMLVSLFAFGFAMSATAGNVADADGDLVPDGFDNCDQVSNGPNDGSNQVDTDNDGYGNACDADYDQNNAVTATDFGPFIAALGTSNDLRTDHDGNGQTTALDFSTFLTQLGQTTPGTSGLGCAGTVPCAP